MKVLFINEILSREKLLHLFFKEKGEKRSYAFPYLVNLNDAQYTTEDLLRELDISTEIIDEIKRTDMAGNLLIILNDNISFNEQDDPLNYDFEKAGSIHYEIFRVNLDKEEVYVHDKLVKLTTLEYKLMRLFLNNIKKVISREELIEYLWGTKEKIKSIEYNLYTHIKNVKRKLAQCGGDNFIHSVYGRGYVFLNPKEYG